MLERKKLRFTHQEILHMQKTAARRGTTVSGMLRMIIHRIAEEGTKAPAPAERTREIVTNVDPDVARAAAERASASGVSLRDAIRFELGVHDLT